MMNKISFIGLGNMGKPMAMNLIKKKYNLYLFDQNIKNYKSFVGKKHSIVNNLKDMSTETKIFITMLPDGTSLSKVVFGRDGILNNASKNSILIDCSTVDYKTTLKVSKAFSDRGLNFLDAPVSGGVSGAKNANLTIMVGGEKKIFDKVRPIFNSLGKNITYVGKSGSGQIVKACNNMMLGINMIGVSEAFLLAEKFKIDKKVFFDICSKSTGASWAMLYHLPVSGIVATSAANKKFKPGYAAKLINKDLKIAQEMSNKVSLGTILGKNAMKIYSSFCKDGNDEFDYSAIIKIYSKNYSKNLRKKN